ncbi:MAG: isoleucine--tRNA ligase [Candidatus Micrarchaeia archaeon]
MDLKQIEKEIQKFWADNKIYESVKVMRSSGRPFYFCDGPPYATGDIHPGTAWNKVMKDAFCRYYRMKGYNVRDQAGFDTHGLPIEVKVEKKLGIKDKGEIESKVGVKNFINECKLFATKYIGLMSDQFRSVGVWLDFDEPYLTYQNSFIEKSWSTIKKAYEKGLLSEELYVVPFCPRCETTSANYELEYHDKTDPSIIVKFKVKGAENKYLLIWTTTPWTLPANVAVMAHPDEEYVEAEVGNERWIFANKRLDYIQSRVNLDITVLSVFPGRELNNMEYEHPLIEHVPIQQGVKHRVVLSDKYVTMEDGTGLVHTAPGHGPEDFIVGKENGLDIICPVGPNGRFTKEAGKYTGYYVFDSNKSIINDLYEKGILVHEEPLTHRYAHCWRCKTPLIYISTMQWFIKVSKLKDSMMSEIEKTYWRPKYAKEQFKAFVSDAPDWCISRQRYWGIPLPIWRCNCGAIKVIGSIKELNTKLEDLHRPEIDEIVLKCDECSGNMHRVKDVLDVWFDSGNVVWASLRTGEQYEKADLIIEGKDQIRGWFYSLLGSGVVNIGSIPYRAVMMHGYFTDEKGEKMSKSVGNFIPLEEMIDRTSVDSFRFWSMQNILWDDIKFNWDEIDDIKRFLIIVANLVSYMQRFYKEPGSGSMKLNPEDEWILLRLNETVKECSEGMDALEPHRATRALKQLLMEDFSRFYMKIAKKRISDNDNADAVYYTLYKVFSTSMRLMSPFTPYLAEYAYQSFLKKYERLDSIHMHNWPTVEELPYDPRLKEQFKYVDMLVGAIGVARNEAGIKTRWPLQKAAVVSNDENMKKAVTSLSGIIKSLSNVKDIVCVENEDDIDYAKVTKVHVCEGTDVYIDASVSEEIYKEGIRNEFTRRVQAMRKEMGLIEMDSIEVYYQTNDEISSIIEEYIEMIAKKVRALKVMRSDIAKSGKEWRIESNEIWIKVVRL